jgi:hypothetical protein
MKFLYFTLILFFALLIVKSYDSEDRIIEGITSTSSGTSTSSPTTSSGTTSSGSPTTSSGTTSGTTNGSANLGYQNYDDQNNANILAQKNTANIQYLNERLNDIKSLENEITNLTNSVKVNTTSIKQISQIIQQQIHKMTGISPSSSPSTIPSLAQAGAIKTTPPPLPPTPMPKQAN